MFDISKVDRIVEMFIVDIYIAILKVKHTSARFDNVQDLLHDFTSWDSVIREFEIIGEASRYLLEGKLITGKYRQVVDFRNKITHEYFGIHPDEIWDIIYNDLEAYNVVIVKLIEEIDPNLKQELLEAFIEDNNYLDFVVKELECLKDIESK